MKAPTLNWIQLPDPIKYNEVKIDLDWTADERTQKAIERQAAIMGYESPTAYLRQAIASVVESGEEDTILTLDGRFLHGTSSGAYGSDGMGQDV
jgi:hypothetical protein